MDLTKAKKQFYDATQINLLDADWQTFFALIWGKKWFEKLVLEVLKAYQFQRICPKISNLFQALRLVNLNQIKVIILGQDPYHLPQRANGLAFAVEPNQPIPSSLRNIFQKLSQEYKCTKPITYLDLKSWVKQGVLLINTTWTVCENKPNSHVHFAWKKFTHELLTYVGTYQKDLIYLGLGKFAQAVILEHAIEQKFYVFASHPSFYSAHISFLKVPIFQEINNRLEQLNLTPIDWLKELNSNESTSLFETN